MEHVEERERERNRLLVWVLVGFTVWWGLTVAGSLIGDWDSDVALGPLLLSSIPAVGFAYAVYRLWQFQERLQAEPDVARALDDELTRKLRLESYAFGFWTMIVAASLFLVLSGLLPAAMGDILSSRTMAGLVLLVGVDAALASFLLRTREAARA